MNLQGSWGSGAPIIKKEKAPEKERFEVRQITQTLNQRREFTLAGSQNRSLSVSRRHETCTRTYDNEKNTYTQTPWTHTGDTDRMHTHNAFTKNPGVSHTPTAVPGFAGGSTSTPAERIALDNAPTTTRKSHTV